MPSQVISGAQKPLRSSPLGTVAPASISEPLIPLQPPRHFGEGFLRLTPGGDKQNCLQPRETASSPRRRGPALAKDIPPPLLPSVLEQTPDLLHRALGGRERKDLETVLAIHPAPSCAGAPDCLFTKGPVCKPVSWYQRTKHACFLKIHPSKLVRSRGCLHAGSTSLIKVIGSLFFLSNLASPRLTNPGVCIPVGGTDCY